MGIIIPIVLMLICGYVLRRIYLRSEEWEQKAVKEVCIIAGILILIVTVIFSFVVLLMNLT